MPTTIGVSGRGWVYRNPKPHQRSVVAYHPSLVRLSGSELLATFDLGQAIEAIDYHTVAARSIDVHQFVEQNRGLGGNASVSAMTLSPDIHGVCDHC